MILPTIHLNGTSRQALREENFKAWEALQAARAMMGEAAPNARDYYVQGAEAYSEARRQWLKQAEGINTIIDHFQTLLDHLNGEKG